MPYFNQPPQRFGVPPGEMPGPPNAPVFGGPPISPAQPFGGWPQMGRRNPPLGPPQPAPSPTTTLPPIGGTLTGLPYAPGQTPRARYDRPGTGPLTGDGPGGPLPPPGQLGVHLLGQTGALGGMSGTFAPSWQPDDPRIPSPGFGRPPLTGLGGDRPPRKLAATRDRDARIAGLPSIGAMGEIGRFNLGNDLSQSQLDDNRARALEQLGPMADSGQLSRLDYEIVKAAQRGERFEVPWSRGTPDQGFWTSDDMQQWFWPGSPPMPVGPDTMTSGVNPSDDELSGYEQAYYQWLQQMFGESPPPTPRDQYGALPGGKDPDTLGKPPVWSGKGRPGVHL